MEATKGQIGDIGRSPTIVARTAIGGAFLAFYATVVVVQGGHVVEHIIQLIQVYVLGVPDDEALGLLGYVFAFQGTEEWLHIVFNVAYLACLVVIATRLLMSPLVPLLARMAFLFFGVWLEGWHVIEHIVIISNVVANNGCPCPGILDSQLGLSDTVLHFGYNAIAYTATFLPFVYLLRQVRPANRSSRRHPISEQAGEPTLAGQWPRTTASEPRGIAPRSGHLGQLEGDRAAASVYRQEAPDANS